MNEPSPPFDPETVLTLVSDVLGRLVEDYSGVDAQKVQLREVVRTVERLEKQGQPIPEDLRRLKLDLIMKTEQASEAEQRLEQLAQGLRESLVIINGALNKPEAVTASGAKPTGKCKKAKKYPKTSQEVLRRYLLVALKELGGSAHCNAVKDRMREMLTGQLLPGDVMQRKTGEIIWENNTHWERNALVKEGILRSDSKRGYWELNDELNGEVT